MIIKLCFIDLIVQEYVFTSSSDSKNCLRITFYSCFLLFDVKKEVLPANMLTASR